MMLGRVGMALNNATTATQAFAHAYQLDPNSLEVRLGYAEVLTRSTIRRITSRRRSCCGV